MKHVALRMSLPDVINEGPSRAFSAIVESAAAARFAPSGIPSRRRRARGAPGPQHTMSRRGPVRLGGVPVGDGVLRVDARPSWVGRRCGRACAGLKRRMIRIEGRNESHDSSGSGIRRADRVHAERKARRWGAARRASFRGSELAARCAHLLQKACAGRKNYGRLPPQLLPLLRPSTLTAISSTTHAADHVDRPPVCLFRRSTARRAGVGLTACGQVLEVVVPVASEFLPLGRR